MTVANKMTMACVIALLAVAALPMEATAEMTAAEQKAEQEAARAREYFTNTELINQDGETVRFFDDVLKGQVVVVNFIFTNCDGACPLMTHKLSLVRDRMEEQIGDTVRFVSLSIDPERDTPAAMKEFAKTHHADHEGWVFLTGKPENLERIIKQLGQYTDDVEAHSTMMLAGNVSSAHWIKIQPHEQPPAITEKLQMLLRDNKI
jgi:protein SCO1/2